jgi:small-conductance mechanosensitive channel
VRTTLWLTFLIVVIILLRKLIKRKIEDTAHQYKFQKLIELFGIFLIVVVILLSFSLDNFEDYTIIIGLFTAGIAFTLQELILSVAGSFYIFAFRVYRPADRIEINNIRGDVIDINSMYTTIMEMGEWVSSDNYSGRIVKISNAFVFKGPIKNYSMDFSFVWDEINILITFESDIALGKQIILSKSTELLYDYIKNSKQKWQEMVARYYIENATLEPTIAINLTDNWVAINLRYITGYKLRRIIKNELFE